MIIYILKTILCSSLLYVVYHFVLEKESIHKFKRFYLLFAVIFSLVVPTITIEALPTVEAGYIAPLESVITNSINANSEINQNEEAQVLLTILSCYFLISAILFARSIVNLGRIVYTSSIKKNKKIILNKRKLILIENLQVPHSFWNTIFLNRTDYENNTIENEILTHELTHIEQKHTADILFIELLLAILWFNPALYLYRRAIKLNHEFLADQSVVQELDQVSHYQLLLIDQASRRSVSMASNFNYLITKKRLIMITKRTSRKKVLSCLLLIVPLLMIITFSFCKGGVEKQTLPTVESTSPTVKTTTATPATKQKEVTEVEKPEVTKGAEEKEGVPPPPPLKTNERNETAPPPPPLIKNDNKKETAPPPPPLPKKNE